MLRVFLLKGWRAALRNAACRSLHCCCIKYAYQHIEIGASDIVIVQQVQVYQRAQRLQQKYLRDLIVADIKLCELVKARPARPGVGVEFAGAQHENIRDRIAGEIKPYQAGEIIEEVQPAATCMTRRS